jgi:hypothetical protein
MFSAQVKAQQQEVIEQQQQHKEFLYMSWFE